MLAGHGLGQAGAEEQHRAGALLGGRDLADGEVLGPLAEELLLGDAGGGGRGRGAVVEALAGDRAEEDAVHPDPRAELEGRGAHEARHGGLRRRVGAHRRRVAQRGARVHQHDRRALRHHRHRGLDEVQRAEEVHVEDLLPARRGRRRPPAPSRRRGGRSARGGRGGRTARRRPSTTARQSSALDRSAGTTTASRPRARTSSAMGSSRSRRREAITTSTPSRAKPEGDGPAHAGTGAGDDGDAAFFEHHGGQLLGRAVHGGRAHAEQLDGLAAGEGTEGEGARRLGEAVGPGGTVGQVVEAGDGDLGRVGELAEVAAVAVEEPAQRGRVGGTEHEPQHVDAAVVPLGPQALGEDQVEGLGGAVGGDVAGAGPGRAGADEDHAAAAPLDHGGAEAVADLHHRRAVAGDERPEVVDRLVEEEGAAVVGAGVEDHQPDLEVGGGLGEALGGVVEAEVEGHHPGLDVELGGQLLEERGAAGDEDDVDASAGQLPGELGPGAVGGAGDDRPRPVGVAERHRRLFGHLIPLDRARCPLSCRERRALPPRAGPLASIL